jgi:hypothetical protein
MFAANSILGVLAGLLSCCALLVMQRLTTIDDAEIASRIHALRERIKDYPALLNAYGREREAARVVEGRRRLRMSDRRPSLAYRKQMEDLLRRQIQTLDELERDEQELARLKKVLRLKSRLVRRVLC